MATILDKHVQRRLRDRQGLLWVCQRHDLKDGESPHDLSASVEDARARYRLPMGTDRELCGFYWECIWLEGAASPLLAVLSNPDGQSSRPPVVLAGADDTAASFSEFQFQPVAVLPGRLDVGPEAPPGQRYGGFERPRQRRKVAENLAQRLTRYPHRVLVVVGAESNEDLEAYLYPTLEDNLILDLDLVVVHPPGRPALRPPQGAGVRFHAWPGTAADLIAALSDTGMPASEASVGWAVRIKYPGRDKTRNVVLAADVVQRVMDQFELVTEDDLRPPARFTIDDLISFLDGVPGAWAGYAGGLPVPRAYQTDAGRSLSDEFAEALCQTELAEPLVARDQVPRRRASTLTLPCEEGSGTTTLLRAAAFAAASRGYPTLVARPGVTDVDLEMITAFATGLTEAAYSAGFESIPPLAVVLDVELAQARAARQLAGTMAAKGRPVVVLRAVPAGDAPAAGPQPLGGPLRPLETRAAQVEVANCERVFRELVARWGLPIGPLPTADDWRGYESKTRWRTTGTEQSHSMFWVALRFFLISGLTRANEEVVRDALGRWIRERDERLTDGIRKVLTWVAALSSQRIACPLGIALRPVTGGAFSSDLVPAMKSMAALVEWQEFSRDLHDYPLRFRHPALAEEYLRLQVGSATPGDAVRVLGPLLQQLVPGRPADRWLAEQLVVHVLTPEYHERNRTDWEWRLEAFRSLPWALASGSRAVLHHWARCLYQSADPRNSPNLLPADRRVRLDTAIRHLQEALELPRHGQREEHPSHLWNTLGVAYARRARVLEESDPPVAKVDWDRAWEAFRKSIDLLPGNIEALMAFSRRLLEHAGATGGSPVADPPVGAVTDVANALGLLDEAEELFAQAQDPDPDIRADLEKHRTFALNWLGTEKVEAHLAALRASADPELAHYCQAQLIAASTSSEDRLAEALSCLGTAATVRPLSPRAIRLELALLRRHSSWQFDFDRLLRASEALERAAAGALHPVEQFRLAVLYFQVGQYPKGDERFRRLRDIERRADVTIPAIQDFWRQLGNPRLPRVTRIRVSRVTNEWRAEGYVDELSMTIPLRPRHFSPLANLHDVVECGIRFEFRGPLAVPKRFLSAGGQ